MSKFDAILSAKPQQGSKREEKTAQNGSDEKTSEAQKTGDSKRAGKRSHPDYTQITAYILKDTHEQVMRRIYKTQEFSELIEELLADWLKNTE